MMVTVPAGVAPGQMLQVVAAGGRPVQVIVPQGMLPGQQFAVVA